MGADVKALLHVHSTFSYDGESTLAELAAWGRRRGLEAIFLSEHVNDFDETKMRRLVAECAALRGSGAELVPGLEFAVRGGFHLLGYGVATFRAEADPAEAVRFIQGQGGVAVLAHPIRYRGRWPAPEVLRVMNGIEVWNARYDGRFFPSGDVMSAFRTRCDEWDAVHPFGGQDLHVVTSNRLVATEASGAGSADEMLDHLRLGQAQFGAQPVRVSMASRPGRLTIACARGLHRGYRLARTIRDRVARTRPVPPAEES